MLIQAFAHPPSFGGPPFLHLATIRVEVQVGSGWRTKRRTVRAIVAKIHRHFNVAIAEVQGESHPSQSTLGVAALAGSRREVREVLDRVAGALAAHPRAEVLQVDWEDH